MYSFEPSYGFPSRRARDPALRDVTMLLALALPFVFISQTPPLDMSYSHGRDECSSF